MIFSLAMNFLAKYSWEKKQFPCHQSVRNILGDPKNPILILMTCITFKILLMIISVGLIIRFILVKEHGLL